MDAVYLKLERLYTRKYNWVIQKRKHTDNYQFNLDPFEKNMWLESESQDIGLIDVMFSWTLLPLYATMLIVGSSGLWMPCIWKI